jgi:hypothetical protein
LILGKDDVGGDELDDEEAAILLGDLEDIGSLGSSSEEGGGAPIISGATSESNSRLTSPASVEVCSVSVSVCVCVCVCVWEEGTYLTNFIISIFSILK